MRHRHSFAPRFLACFAIILAPTPIIASPSAPAAVATDPLAASFEAPPQSASPIVRWDWLDGNVTTAGIAADMDALARAGIGEARVTFVAGPTPDGPAMLGSKPFQAALKAALSEARRTGLRLGIAVAPGLSGNGAPWISPADAMKTTVTEEIRFKGPGRARITLPSPAVAGNYYRDIAVLAFPTPLAELPTMADLHTRVSGSSTSIDGSLLRGAGDSPFTWLPAPTAAAPQVIQIDFDQPQPIRSFSAQLGPGTLAVSGTVQAADGAGEYRDIARFEFHGGGNQPDHTIGLPDTTASSFRLLLTGGVGADHQIAIGRVAILPRAALADFAAKALRDTRSENVTSFSADSGGSSADVIIDPKNVIDLTSRLASNGRLDWDAPAGEWTVFRVGYTCANARNSLAWRAGEGFECDRLSSHGADALLSGLFTDVARMAGRDSGKTLVDACLRRDADQAQNWTDEMRAQFTRRRGYDPLLMLPVLGGHIVTSIDASERFLWDLRKTTSELFADVFMGRLGQECTERSMALVDEPGSSDLDRISRLGRETVPVFAYSPDASRLEASRVTSAAHLYGRPIIEAALSPSATSSASRLSVDPVGIKLLADEAFCEGANRIELASFTHEPYFTAGPGLIEALPGLLLSRNTPWWSGAAGETAYLARVSGLLQQGVSVADVLLLCGEQSGAAPRVPALPAGYRGDLCSADALVNLLSVKDGRIVSPGGASYRLLLMPDDISMRPEVLEAIRSLVEHGAIVMGRRPYSSPSLQRFPAADDDVRKLSAELWGPGEEGGIGERSYGKGRVLWGGTIETRLKDLGLQADFDVLKGSGSPIDWIHRSSAGSDIYFLVNHEAVPIDAVCAFRTPNAAAELWDPAAGDHADAAVYLSGQDGVVMPIHLEPVQSMFVILRRDTPQRPHLTEFKDLSVPVPTVHVEVRRASWEAVDGSWSSDVTASLQQRFDAGRYRTPVTDEAFGSEIGPATAKQLRIDYVVGGASVTAVIPAGGVFLPAGLGDGGEVRRTDIRRGASGGIEIAASRRIVYEIATVDGKTTTGVAGEASEAVPIEGAWQVSFPAGLGAPPRLTLPELAPLNTSDNLGVRFFSGRAVYEKDITIDSSQIGPQFDNVLDLGSVRNVAEVSVNGKFLGDLWTPPFRIRITDALKPGVNHLAIAVANTWANRLIGDETLSDGDWQARLFNGAEVQTLASWPDWLVASKSSPGPRVAFSTLRLYSKEEACPQSGLMGPVILRKIEKVNIAVP